MTVRNCSACLYYLGQEIGACRRFPTYQTRSRNEWCGEFAEKANLPDSTESGVFSHIERQLIELPVLVEPPKRKGRPKKNV
jgi:hypothetical protein